MWCISTWTLFLHCKIQFLDGLNMYLRKISVKLKALSIWNLPKNPSTTSCLNPFKKERGIGGEGVTNDKQMCFNTQWTVHDSSVFHSTTDTSTSHCKALSHTSITHSCSNTHMYTWYRHTVSSWKPKTLLSYFSHKKQNPHPKPVSQNKCWSICIYR